MHLRSTSSPCSTQMFCSLAHLICDLGMSRVVPTRTPEVYDRAVGFRLDMFTPDKEVEPSVREPVASAFGLAEDKPFICWLLQTSDVELLAEENECPVTLEDCLLGLLIFKPRPEALIRSAKWSSSSGFGCLETRSLREPPCQGWACFQKAWLFASWEEHDMTDSGPGSRSPRIASAVLATVGPGRCTTALPVLGYPGCTDDFGEHSQRHPASMSFSDSDDRTAQEGGSRGNRVSGPRPSVCALGNVIRIANGALSIIPNMWQQGIQARRPSWTAAGASFASAASAKSRKACKAMQRPAEFAYLVWSACSDILLQESAINCRLPVYIGISCHVNTIYFSNPWQPPRAHTDGIHAWRADERRNCGAVLFGTQCAGPPEDTAQARFRHDASGNGDSTSSPSKRSRRSSKIMHITIKLECNMRTSPRSPAVLNVKGLCTGAEYTSVVHFLGIPGTARLGTWCKHYFAWK
ncbi:hypothetical protein BD413DRAFT_495159 [Trametes elegans]|nr:hypothetical protein BD413DRAFT_495159 [Trametes elegans]